MRLQRLSRLPLSRSIHSSQLISFPKSANRSLCDISRPLPYSHSPSSYFSYPSSVSSSPSSPSGIFAVYKPAGMTSASAVTRIKYALGKKAAKVGHGGTLDQAAEGVLVIGVGEGCKLLGSYNAARKEYVAQMTLGVATDTYDVEGKIIQSCPTTHITREVLENALSSFRGDIQQRPPSYSAVKTFGVRLSDRIRGKSDTEEHRPGPRPVTVHSLSLLDFLPSFVDAPVYSPLSPTFQTQSTEQQNSQFWLVKNNISEAFCRKYASLPIARIHLACDAGFYVRSLCHDLGASLDSCACMSSLIRTRVGVFNLSDAMDMTSCTKQAILDRLALSGKISKQEIEGAKSIARAHMSFRQGRAQR